MAMQKAVLVTKDGERIGVQVEECYDAGVINYVTDFGATVRTFRYQSSHKVQTVPVFEECTVAYITGRDDRLERRSCTAACTATTEAKQSHQSPHKEI